MGICHVVCASLCTFRTLSNIIPFVIRFCPIVEVACGKRQLVRVAVVVMV